MRLDEVRGELLPIVSRVGALVGVPREAEEFFSKIVRGFAGSRDEFLQYVEQHIETWFICVGAPPQWIQESEWQYCGGKPMVFVGEIRVPRTRGFFHDDAIFFLFWDPETGTTKTVIQVA